MKKVTFRGAECEAVFCQYENGRTAIRLTENGSPFATATLNDPDIWLSKNQVIIKDYSENEGMTDALVAAGVVEKQEEIAIGNFASRAWICGLLNN